ncbi:MAG: GAF domain-containing sensor histidine kinase [Actinomycetota bacterium]
MTGGHEATAHVHAALRREASLARLLLDAARLLGETLEPQRVYERFREILADAVRYDGLIVSSYEPSDHSIRCDYAWADGQTLDASTFPPLQLNTEGGMQSQVIRTGRPFLTNDVAGHVAGPGVYYDTDGSGKLRKVPDEGPTDAQAALMIPVKHEGVVVGVVQLMTDHGAYTGDDLDLVEGLVGQMAAAVRNARLHEERARAEAREAAAQAVAAEREEAVRVLAAVGDAVVFVAEDGTIRYRNPAAAELGADDLDWQAIGARIGAPAGTRATLPVDVNGRELWLSFVAVRTTDGVVYAFRDVTQDRELDSAKSDFIATVSHELRTPMTSVLGAAMTLLRDDIDLAPEQRQELLEMIARQAQRLAHVTEEVLLANSLDRGEIHVERAEVDVDRVVRDAVQIQLPGAELQLRAATATADRDRLQQVLLNLLENATKYGGQHVLVTSEDRGDMVRIAVTDDGPGLAPGEQQRVFEKFFRADPQMVHSPPGTGLGLYICKELVERMGGRIGVDSHPGRGATFWFELPR